MAEKKDLTNPRNFFSWVFYGLSGTIATVSAVAYADMRKQRDEAVDRVNTMTDKVWNLQFKNNELKQENEQKDEIIKYADSTLRDNTQMEAEIILKTE